MSEGEPKLSCYLEHARKVDLGSGPRPKPGFVGLDLGVYEPDPEHEVWQFDLGSGDAWPLADGQVVELYCSHLIEHLPATMVRAHEFTNGQGERSKEPGLQRSRGWQDALFWFMDEAWRVCEPGARFELHWPALIDLRVSPPRWLVSPFMDPTHRRFIPFETLCYFDREQRQTANLTGYAVTCDWELVDRLQGDLGFGHVENIAILKKRSA